MALKKSRLKIISLAHTIYKKCECCDRVKDIYFQMLVYDSASGSFLYGNFLLCKTCGENLGDVLNISINTAGTASTFKFE